MGLLDLAGVSVSPSLPNLTIRVCDNFVAFTALELLRIVLITTPLHMPVSQTRFPLRLPKPKHHEHSGIGGYDYEDHCHELLGFGNIRQQKPQAV